MNVKLPFRDFVRGLQRVQRRLRTDSAPPRHHLFVEALEDRTLLSNSTAPAMGPGTSSSSQFNANAPMTVQSLQQQLQNAVSTINTLAGDVNSLAGQISSIAGDTA